MLGLLLFIPIVFGSAVVELLLGPDIRIIDEVVVGKTTYFAVLQNTVNGNNPTYLYECENQHCTQHIIFYRDSEPARHATLTLDSTNQVVIAEVNKRDKTICQFDLETREVACESAEQGSVHDE